MKSLQPFYIREQVLKSVRTFFEQREFHEIIPPTLNYSIPLEPHIYAFATQWQADQTQELYLSTSPEKGMKKMLSLGIGNCFGIGKCFRNLEGSGSVHSPEFMMLEWYRENSDYKQIMRDTRELIIFIKQKIDTYLKKPESLNLEYDHKKISLGGEWSTYSLVELFKEYANMDFLELLDDADMKKKAQEKGYIVDNAIWPELFDQILVNEVEPHLPQTPFFLIDFPARMSPLCRVKENEPRLVERFEIYMFGMELGNGNTENTDVDYVKNLFQIERAYRLKKGILAPPIDEEFLDSLRIMSSKTYGGIGLGIDRLAMIMANQMHIKNIDPFYK